MIGDNGIRFGLMRCDRAVTFGIAPAVGRVGACVCGCVRAWFYNIHMAVGQRLKATAQLTRTHAHARTHARTHAHTYTHARRHLKYFLLF